MSGVVESPEVRLGQLFDEFVVRYEPRDEGGRRRDEDVKRDVARQLIRLPVKDSLRWDYAIQSANYFYEFQAGWRNGRPQVLEPISFDLAQGKSIVEKANLWTGRLANLTRGSDFAFSAIVAPPQEVTLGRAFDQALAMLRGAPAVRTIVTEDHAEQLFSLIEQDIEAHPHSQT
jgi:hypothetical protein